MATYWFEVFQIFLRFFHVVVGIAWIGASFYFVWLDNNLGKPPEWKKDKGIGGDLWAIHGGGFYEIAKYKNAPETMPNHLHWFKWEAYTTWITGILLLSLLYYVAADAYLLDAAKSEIDKFSAIALSIGSIVLGFSVYMGLCQTPLVKNGFAFAVVSIALLTLWSYVLDQFLSDRAAYIHVGALIGTCMAANVFMVIMPAQRYMVAEVAAGRVPKPDKGLKAKMHSVHNNYVTLPIIFIMLSNHASFTYGHEYGWLVLSVLFVIGMWIRHYFNLKNRGINQPWVIITGIFAFFVLMALVMPKPQVVLDEAGVAVSITDEQAWVIIDKHCTECHSETPRSKMFPVAPNGFKLDSLEQANVAKVKMYPRVVIAKDMPLANLTQMTDEERGLLGSWLGE